MIPKKIHYCWFGRKPIPDSVRRCMQSWQKFCPDYLIVEWNEKNFNIKECPQYVIDAYHRKKWAFVTDYVRLRVVVWIWRNIFWYRCRISRKRLIFLLKYSAFFLDLKIKNIFLRGLDLALNGDAVCCMKWWRCIKRSRLF